VNAPDIRVAAVELTRQTRKRQGLPTTIEDESAIARVAAVVVGVSSGDPPESAEAARPGGPAVDREVVVRERP
jgi:hypothetical protein